MTKNFSMLTQEEKNNIIQMFYDGKSKYEIIKEANVTTRTYPAVFKEAGINTKRRNKYTLNEDYFEKIDSQEKAYLLGLIASDGCVTEKNYFALASIDIEVLELLKKELEYTGDIYIPKRKEQENWNTAYRINFSSKKICKDLAKYGVIPNKTFSFNKIPDIKPIYYRHFIRGYFDGDGCIYSYDNDKRYAFEIICTESLATEFGNVFYENIGEFGFIQKTNSLELKALVFYKISSLKKIYDMLYTDATCFIKRKYDKYNKFMGSLRSKYLSEKWDEPEYYRVYDQQTC